MLFNISFLTAFATTLLLAVSYFIYKFYINPYLKIQFYKKQGATPLWFWSTMSVWTHIENLFKHDGFFYKYIETFKKNPGTKVIVENNKSIANLMLCDPKMIKECLSKYEIYPKCQEGLELCYYLSGRSTPFAEGADWKKQKMLINSALKFESIKDGIPVAVKSTQREFNDWITSGKLNQVNIVLALETLAGDFMGKYFFGETFVNKKINDDLYLVVESLRIIGDLFSEQISLSYRIFGDSAFKANILPRHRKLHKEIADCQKEFKKIIEAAVESAKTEKTVFAQLLELHNKGNQKDGLTKEQFFGEFIGNFWAGAGTISHHVSLAIFFLVQNPHLIPKLKEEVDREFSDPTKIELDTISRMEYTTAVLKETFRLGGPSPGLFERIATKDDDLCGFKVKKGDHINFCFALTHEDEKYFSNPTEFDPERWLKGTSYTNDGYKSEPYAFIPFGGGAKNCAGQNLAKQVTVVILGLFIRTFDFTGPADYKFALSPVFDVMPLYPLLLDLKPRV